MNKKIFIMPVLMCGLVSAAFADIDKNNDSPNCNTGALGVESGSTNLEAVWAANKIGISWYDGNTKLEPVNEGADECNYDEGIILPGNQLSREGYTFGGWTVRGVYCGAGNLNAETDGTAFYGRTLVSGVNYCDYNGSNAAGANCNYQIFNDMSYNQWKVVFPYGTIKGEASCNSTSGSSLFDQDGYNYMNDAVAAANMSRTDTGGSYCWCRLIAVNGKLCSATTSNWIYFNEQTSHCDSQCARACASYARTDAVFRTAMFSQEQP